MKKNVRVTVVQMDIKGLDVAANLAHMCELIDLAVGEAETDLIVFPELANSGYVKAWDVGFHKEYLRCAEKVPGHFTTELGARAAKHRVHLVAGFLEAHPRVPHTLYNSAILIDSKGKIVGKHHKMHIPSAERNYFYPGNTSAVFATDLGNIAVQVCSDSNFPELSRVFALQGAEIVCAVYNVPRAVDTASSIEERIHHIAVCRAIENQNFFIGCNRVGHDDGGTFVGHSCVAGPLGETLAYSTSDREELLRATLQEETLVHARVRFTFFRERKPEMYRLIGEPL